VGKGVNAQPVWPPKRKKKMKKPRVLKNDARRGGQTHLKRKNRQEHEWKTGDN